jgi:hypothetical protein
MDVKKLIVKVYGGLLHDAINISDYILMNGRVIGD